MNYIEYRFELRPVLPAREVLVAELAEIGFESFVETPDGLLAYIRKDQFNEEALTGLMVFEIPDQVVEFQLKEIPDENWNAEWEKQFEPIAVEDLVAVRAPFHPPMPGFSHEIVIEPKMSFGTGHHATTWMMLKVICSLELNDLSVLDMGSGTGVLAILAEMRGASKVDAIDNDDWAYQNALENVERNAAKAVRVIHGDADFLGETRYDVILANINRNILTADAARYINVLKPGGYLLLSGFFTEDIPILLNDFSGLREKSRASRDGWALLMMEAPKPNE